MTTQATLVYTAPLTAGSYASLDAALSAVPIPAEVYTIYGLRLISDATSGGVRTIVFGLGPTTNAIASASRVPGSIASPVTAVAVSNAGAGYVLPPQVILRAGFGTDGIQDDGEGAEATANMVVGSAVIVTPGSGYTAPTVVFEGGLAPGGVAATGTVSQSGGAISGVIVVTPGSGYTGAPSAVISDPTGSGAVITSGLTVASVTVTNPGVGYAVNPSVNFIPRFLQYFPNGTNQAFPLVNLMTAAIQRLALVQVVASAPVIV
jgi:hypothetical protein